MTKRTLWHLADPDTEDRGWHKVELHATDAVHALAADPDHWKTENPEDRSEIRMDDGEAS